MSEAITTSIVGQRVILNTFLRAGDFPGTIIHIFGNICTVKLDCQDKPVYGVLYYDVPPDIITSSRLQCCYPLHQEHL